MTGRVARVTASDNREAIKRLSQDPLTIHGTRFDAVRGLVDLMDAALAAAPRFRAPALFLYGGKDELIPDKATAATWRGLPEGPVRAFYPGGLPPAAARPRADDADRRHPVLDAPSGHGAAVGGRPGGGGVAGEAGVTAGFDPGWISRYGVAGRTRSSAG